MGTVKAYYYTDTERRELTHYLTAISIESSINAPYHRASLSLKSTPKLERLLLPQTPQGTAGLDLWILVTEELDAQERALFIGPAQEISRTLRATESAALTTDTLTLTASSPLAHMMSAAIYLSGRPQGIDGHINTLKTWGGTMRELFRAPFQNNNVGAVFERIYNKLAPPYRFPTLLGADLSQIPVIYSAERARQYTPTQAPLFRSIHGLAVNVVSQATNTSGSPWQILAGAFDVDPNLVELFYTLEPATKGPLSQKIGATPAIIYRFKPYIFGQVNAPAGVNAANEQTQNAAKTPHKMTANEIIYLSTTQSDQDRTNAAYVDTPLTISRGVESFGLLANPALNREDIDRAGLRMYRANWPFFPPRGTAENMAPHTRYLVAIASTITGQAHQYARAQASTAYRPDLRAGLWLKLQITERRALVAYIETVSHNLSMSGATLTRRSQLTLARAFYIEEGDA